MNQCSYKSSISVLNDDVIRLIISMVPHAALLPVIMTCKRFHDMAVVMNLKSLIHHRCTYSLFEYCTTCHQHVDRRRLESHYCMTDSMVSWALSMDCPHVELMNACALYGRLQQMIHLMRHIRTHSHTQDPAYIWGNSCGHIATEYAARGGHLDVLKWLRSQDPPCPWGKRTCFSAAEGGHFEVLQWLFSEDCQFPCDEWTCSDAAMGGHLDICKWFRLQKCKCPWDVQDCIQAAAGGGHLDICKWLRPKEPSCSLHAKICSDAARGGHLEVLKWLRSLDPPCPWNCWTCTAAAEGGHLDVLQWLRSQDPPCPLDLSTINYFCRGHLGILQWLSTLSLHELDIYE